VPTSDEYRHNAEDCVRAASEVPDKQERQFLLRMAEQWRRLADYKAGIEAPEDRPE
jgi:hypothetical protein